MPPQSEARRSPDSIDDASAENRTQSRIVPAVASQTLLSPLKLGNHWVQPFSRAAPTSSEPAAPGGVIPVVRNYHCEIQHKNLRWDDQNRDQFARPGFIYGFNLNFGSRCLVPALRVEYPDCEAIQDVSSIEGGDGKILWLAATIHTTNGGETFSILTAPRHEQSASTSVHEPVPIAPANALQWFDVSIHPSLLVRAASVMERSNPLIWKAA